MIQEGPVISLAEGQCRTYMDSVEGVFSEKGSLRVLEKRENRDSLFRSAADIFGAEIKEIEHYLLNPSVGVVAIDVCAPEPDGDHTFSALLRASVALGIGGSLMDPTLDGVNGTPFTLYNASLENEKALTAVGLAFNSPSEKLGFHSDGRVASDGIYVPHTLMIHNLLVAYERPGDFYWAPSVLWRERERFRALLRPNRKYRIALTPIVYGDGVRQMQVHGAGEVEVPIFWDNGLSETVFLNGEVKGGVESDGGDFDPVWIAEMKASIAESADKFRISQRVGRTIFARNSAGFHARDVMEKPFGGTKYTRSMIRAVDSRGVRIA